MDKNIIYSVGILDTKGSIVHQQQKNARQLDISRLPAGIYFVRLILNDQTVIKKLVKE